MRPGAWCLSRSFFTSARGNTCRSDTGPITVDCADVTQLHGRDAVMLQATAPTAANRRGEHGQRAAGQDSADLCQLVEGNLICFDVPAPQRLLKLQIPTCT